MVVAAEPMCELWAQLHAGDRRAEFEKATGRLSGTRADLESLCTGRQPASVAEQLVYPLRVPGPADVVRRNVVAEERSAVAVADEEVIAHAVIVALL